MPSCLTRLHVDEHSEDFSAFTVYKQRHHCFERTLRIEASHAWNAILFYFYLFFELGSLTYFD
jgi:hypothetical protein